MGNQRVLLRKILPQLELLRILLSGGGASDNLTIYLSQVAACILDNRLPLTSTESKYFQRYVDIAQLLADPCYPLECKRILLLTHFNLTFTLYYRMCR